MHRIDVYFCWGLPNILNEDRLKAAAELLLQSFPALGGRLSFVSVPALIISKASFPLSFASWPTVSAADLFGKHATASKPPLPIYDLLDVISMLAPNPQQPPSSC